MKRNHNHRKCKIHRSYTVEEVTELYDVHPKTVRNWIQKGLPIFDDIRPLLILGTDLKLFIQKDSFCNSCYNLWRIGADLEDVKDTMIFTLLKIKGQLETDLVKAKEKEAPQPMIVKIGE